MYLLKENLKAFGKFKEFKVLLWKKVVAILRHWDLIKKENSPLIKFIIIKKSRIFDISWHLATCLKKNGIIEGKKKENCGDDNTHVEC